MSLSFNLLNYLLTPSVLIRYPDTLRVLSLFNLTKKRFLSGAFISKKRIQQMMEVYISNLVSYLCVQKYIGRQHICWNYYCIMGKKHTRKPSPKRLERHQTKNQKFHKIKAWTLVPNASISSEVRHLTLSHLEQIENGIENLVSRYKNI